MSFSVTSTGVITQVNDNVQSVTAIACAAIMKLKGQFMITPQQELEAYAYAKIVHKAVEKLGFAFYKTGKS